MKHYFNAYMRFRCPVCNYSNPDYVVDEEDEAECVKCKTKFKPDYEHFDALDTVNDLVSTFFAEHSIALVTFVLTLSMTLFYAVVTFTRINGW